MVGMRRLSDLAPTMVFNAIIADAGVDLFMVPLLNRAPYQAIRR